MTLSTSLRMFSEHFTANRYSAAFPTDRRPVVISGPSGAGKGTLINKLCDSHPGVFSKTVSHTTRKPRVGEEDGVAYHFVSGAQFRQLVDNNAFIEHTTYSGNQYGTSKATVREQTDRGLVVLLDIELQGVIAVKSTPDIDARFVFIQPPSLEVLEARLRSRSSDSDEDIEKRLQQAAIELEYASSHPGFHDLVIINDDLTQASQHLDDFVFGRQE